MDFSSGVHVSPLVPPLVAFLISAVTATGGLSGAFLLLPFQMSVLGYTAPGVSATNHLYNVVAIPPGVARYVREGRMLWPMAGVVVAATVPGVLIGAVVRVRWLPDPRAFKLFVGLVLLWIGLRMLRSVLRPVAGGARGGPVPRLRTIARSWRRVVYEFRGEEHAFSVLRLFALSFAVGVVGGIYGIGGGAIIVPFVVTFFRLPVHTIAGAALLGTCATSLMGVAFYAALAPFYPEAAVTPDWALGALFGLGGMAGTYCGARLQKRLPERLIKGILTALLLYLATRYVSGFFLS